MLRARLGALFAAVVAAAAFAASADLGFSRSVSERLTQHYMRLFGPGAATRLAGWKDFVRAADVKSARQDELLRPVNGYFNRIPAFTDQAHWGAEDYWATPAETMASNGGDCEDYAIAKYFTLKELGVPISRLRLVYVRTPRAAHMVLAYYPDAQSDPLILDNLHGSIESATARTDLTPVYSFNDEDLQLGPNMPRVSATSNRKWADVMQKLERELRL
jgi:predicted transglutaminase-like cysteine proteinase